MGMYGEQREKEKGRTGEKENKELRKEVTGHRHVYGNRRKKRM